MDIQKSAEQVFDYVVDFRRDIHEHPEPSFEEFRTTDKIAQALDEIGIPYRRLNPTGLIGTITGEQFGKTVALRADIDALSVTEKSGVLFASQNEGFMHACGHDTHTAMLLGAAKILYENRNELCGTIKLIFQPAEEVAKGAKAVIDQGGLDGVDMILGLHITAQHPVGMLALGEGASMSAADEFTITIKGKSCHGAMPETGVDATVTAAAIIMNLQTIVSREIAPIDTVVVTVGELKSGTRFNVISGEAIMKGTVRSFNRDTHTNLPPIVERIAKQTAETFRCKAEMEYNMMTEVLINDSEASKIALSAAKKVAASSELVVTMPKMMGAEDFAEYTARVPAAFIFLGGGGEHPQHSDYFQIDEEAFKTGVAWYVQAAYDFLNHCGNCHESIIEG